MAIREVPAATRFQERLACSNTQDNLHVPEFVGVTQHVEHETLLFRGCGCAEGDKRLIPEIPTTRAS